MLARRVEREGQVRTRRINGRLGYVGDLGIGQRETQLLTGLLGIAGQAAGSFFGSRAGVSAGISAISPALQALSSQGATLPTRTPTPTKAPPAPAAAPAKPGLSTNVKIAIAAGGGALLLGGLFLFMRGR